MGDVPFVLVFTLAVLLWAAIIYVAFGRTK